ncbi:hypothetical protein [Streptomyces sp. NPDC019937]|uniref:hypothetical protein n=1 Tax=Streptomyces sp. NPDC019937 TaxID=3154787 RepID=UPI0033EE537F
MSTQITDPPPAAELEALRARVAKLDRSETALIGERDHMHDVADKLAYAIAPIEVIGEHSSANDPWQNALDIVTPAAEVDRLRARVAELEAERQTTNAALLDVTVALRAAEGEAPMQVIPVVENVPIPVLLTEMDDSDRSVKP